MHILYREYFRQQQTDSNRSESNSPWILNPVYIYTREDQEFLFTGFSAPAATVL